MAAPSMAAALAANLPAAAPPPSSAPAHEAIPASIAKLMDIEAEIPLAVVQLDGLVVSKILKHAREHPSGSAHGLLLGLDLDGVLQVSDSFSLPHNVADDDEKSAKATARYQSAMLRSLKEVQSDDTVVGFYQATSLGAFFNQSFIDTQAIHQTKLRHGGVAIVHDLSQAARGNASFRAFRLTPAFLEAYKKSSFNAASLVNYSLTFSSILVEIPVKIRTNPLLSAFLGALNQPFPSSLSDCLPSQANSSALPPSFAPLSLGPAGLAKNLEQMADAIDGYRTEESNLAYLSRQIAREKAKADTYVMKRKEENMARVAQGLAPLPEEDVSRVFKIPPEPSRLESFLQLGQIDAYAKSLTNTASTTVLKMYSAKASSGI